MHNQRFGGHSSECQQVFKLNPSRKKSTSIVRLYRFDKMYDPQSYFYRLEREIMFSSLPDDLIKSELTNLREQYNAYLETTSL